MNSVKTSLFTGRQLPIIETGQSRYRDSEVEQKMNEFICFVVAPAQTQRDNV